jgi:hypothetical protein
MLQDRQYLEAIATAALAAEADADGTGSTPEPIPVRKLPAGVDFIVDPEPVTSASFSYDHRINATHPVRPLDIEEALASECVSRLRLQKIISELWTALSVTHHHGRDSADAALDILEKEFPLV